MTVPTSDERRNVAARLRQMADAHDAIEAVRVGHALGLEYKVYGTVVAFDSSDIRKLADLIDPTCAPEAHNYGSIVGHACPRCGWSVAGYMRYCPGCGARVVSYNGN